MGKKGATPLGSIDRCRSPFSYKYSMPLASTFICDKSPEKRRHDFTSFVGHVFEILTPRVTH
jgi:hypothetical protein